jgi:hypothetical protein
MEAKRALRPQRKPCSGSQFSLGIVVVIARVAHRPGAHRIHLKLLEQPLDTYVSVGKDSDRQSHPGPQWRVLSFFRTP